MPDKEKVIIVGSGAQAKYALETFGLTGVGTAGVLDPGGDNVGLELGGHPVEAFGGEKSLVEMREQGATGFIVCAADNRLKERLFGQCLEAGLSPVSAIHPSAVVASTARLGQGLIINPLAVIQPFARIGDGVMVHAGAIIEHDNTIGSFANLGPGVRLAGWVRVGKRATLYTGAVVIPGQRIGGDAEVGAGAVVIRDVTPGTTVAGVPAREGSG